MSLQKLERIAREGILTIAGWTKKYFPTKQEILTESLDDKQILYKNGLKTHQRYLRRMEKISSQNSYSPKSEMVRK